MPIVLRECCLVTAMFVCIVSNFSIAQQPTINLNDIPNTLEPPKVVREEPAAGRRVWQSLDAYKDWQVAHTLYLPSDWQAGKRYPVIFEYPGNGGFKNPLGDTSDGTVEGCRLGFGLTEGVQAIWVCLPFVDSKNHKHSLTWWGDADETARYCEQAINAVCEQWGGDRDRLVLCGFSRGAIATSYIGLRNDRLASKWRAILAHSHLDGVRRWPYPDSDAGSAMKRLQRFAGKPQWISHEESVSDMVKFLKSNELMHDKLHLVALPYPNHSPDWLLKDLPITTEARTWWREVIK